MRAADAGRLSDLLAAAGRLAGVRLVIQAGQAGLARAAHFWLRKAEEHRWPVKHLRRQVRASLAERSAGQDDQNSPGPDRHDWVVLSLQIRLSPSQLATCRAAADRSNLSIEAWTVLALEHAARHELGRTETRQPSDS
jgi:hypothetical protein